MHYFDNLQILKKMNEKLYKRLNTYEEEIELDVEETKVGVPTLVRTQENQKKVYFHSKYNPIQEAETFVNQLGDLTKYDHLLFIGTGLGYHIKQILELNPKIKFSIFEPNISILKQFLTKVNLKKYNTENFVEIFTNSDEIVSKVDFFKYYSEFSSDIIFPVTERLNRNEIEKFFDGILPALRERKSSVSVNAQLQQRWMINPIINFPNILKTPNLLLDLNKEYFKNKPVLLVSAGPSLAEDIEYVRRIKAENRAYVFAMGSAIKSLLSYDIIPDAYFSVDPNFTNQFVVTEVKERGLNIPMCFGSSTGFETVKNYPGKLINFMLNQDKFTKYMLEYNNEIVIYDAVSVTNMTLQALIKLEVGPIILAGQNFAFLNNRRYADGINYNHRSSEITERDKKDIKYTQSVYGEEIETNEEFLNMKSSMELWLRRYPNLVVYNTTKNGAFIKHTTFMHIDEVIEKVLTDKNVVPSNWTEGEPTYDLRLVKRKMVELENSFDELIKYGNKSLEYLNEINNSYKNNFSMLPIYLSAFDQLFNLLQDNIFYKTVVVPMSRVQHENFINKSPDVAKAKLPKDKVKLFNDIFGSYIKTIYACIVHIQPAFGDMKMQLEKEQLLIKE